MRSQYIIYITQKYCTVWNCTVSAKHVIITHTSLFLSRINQCFLNQTIKKKPGEIDHFFNVVSSCLVKRDNCNMLPSINIIKRCDSFNLLRHFHNFLHASLVYISELHALLSWWDFIFLFDWVLNWLIFCFSCKNSWGLRLGCCFFLSLQGKPQWGILEWDKSLMQRNSMKIDEEW